MTARRRQTGLRAAEKYQERRQLYVVEGSAARELAPREIPVPERTWQEEERRREEEKRSRKLRERALTISPTFTMLLAFACVMMLAICVYYLQARVSVYGKLGEIEALENELAELKEANEAASSRIEAASDINRIYKIATEELGMVYPKDSQIIRYDRTESEYVQQYEKIPEE